jgi:hypothetical protein
MKFWTSMEWRQGKLDEILDYDGVALGELDEILDYDGVELPALCHQQHGSRKLGTASLSPVSAKNNAFFKHESCCNNKCSFLFYR